jgi:hypothetical protein
MLEGSHPNLHHKSRDEDGRAYHDEQKEQHLLESVQAAQIDGVQARLGHGARYQEEGIGVADAPGRR